MDFSLILFITYIVFLSNFKRINIQLLKNVYLIVSMDKAEIYSNIK